MWSFKANFRITVKLHLIIFQEACPSVFMEAGVQSNRMSYH